MHCLGNFQSIKVDMAFNNYYKRAPIILERVVELEALENTFISKVFKERTWTKLLNPVGNVYAEVISKFYANAVMEGDRIGC